MEILFKTNIIALVGGGKNPKFPLNKVIIWDDQQKKQICELRLKSTINNVKLKKDIIFIICQNKIYVFKLYSLDMLSEPLETFDNPKGIFALSLIENKTIIAYPFFRTKGYIQIKSFGEKSNTLIINAHDSKIFYLSMNRNGTLIASCSEKGTLIRLFRSDNGELVQELRRGSDHAQIYCICFDAFSKFIACSSDKKTIHIFSLRKANKSFKDEKEEKDENDKDNYFSKKNDYEEPKNPKSIFSTFGKLFKIKDWYFNSEWSLAQYRIKEVKSICHFGPDKTIIVISNNGKYYQARFDPSLGGECFHIKTLDLNI